MLPLHDYSYLKPFDFVFMLSCGVALDLVVESRSNHSGARGQIAPLNLFQAATFEQARNLDSLLFLPYRRKSLVSHCCAVVLRVWLRNVNP